MKLCINCIHFGDTKGHLNPPCKRNRLATSFNRSDRGACGPQAVFFERAPLLGALTGDQLAFLRRFGDRGWLFADRDDPAERATIQAAMRQGYLRRRRGEAHFTTKGRAALRRAGM